MRKIDVVPHLGRRYGKWIVLGECHDEQPGRKKRRMVVCECACGRIGSVHLDNLLSGKSSGCVSCSGRAGKKNPRWAGYEDIPGQLWGILQKSAAARGIDVGISISDLQLLWERQEGKCALTGIQLVLASKKNGLTASVDRIDSSVGYVRGNVQFVHKDVNLMKNRFNQEYFIEVCRLVALRAAA